MNQEFLFYIQSHQNSFIGIWIFLFSLFLWFGTRKKKRPKVTQSYKVLDRLEQILSPAQQFAYLKKVNPYLFEELVLSAFDKKGYSIIRNKKYSGDVVLMGKCTSTTSSTTFNAKDTVNTSIDDTLKSLLKFVTKNAAKGYLFTPV